MNTIDLRPILAEVDRRDDQGLSAVGLAAAACRDRRPGLEPARTATCRCRWPCIRDSALAHNHAWMRDFAAATGVLLAPHGKTTMAPQIFAQQLAAGAWGMTVANVQQLGICARGRRSPRARWRTSCSARSRCAR